MPDPKSQSTSPESLPASALGGIEFADLAKYRTAVELLSRRNRLLDQLFAFDTQVAQFPVSEESNEQDEENLRETLIGNVCDGIRKAYTDLLIAYVESFPELPDDEAFRDMQRLSVIQEYNAAAIRKDNPNAQPVLVDGEVYIPGIQEDGRYPVLEKRLQPLVEAEDSIQGADTLPGYRWLKHRRQVEAGTKQKTKELTQLRIEGADREAARVYAAAVVENAIHPQVLSKFEQDFSRLKAILEAVQLVKFSQGGTQLQKAQGDHTLLSFSRYFDKPHAPGLYEAAMADVEVLQVALDFEKQKKEAVQTLQELELELTRVFVELEMSAKGTSYLAGVFYGDKVAEMQDTSSDIQVTVNAATEAFELLRAEYEKTSQKIAGARFVLSKGEESPELNALVQAIAHDTMRQLVAGNFFEMVGKVKLAIESVSKKMREPKALPVLEKPAALPQLEVEKGETEEVLYEGPCDTWGVSSAGVVIKKGNQFFINGKCIYTGNPDYWAAYANGIVVREGTVVQRSDGTFLFDRNGETWNSSPYGDAIVPKGNKILVNNKRVLFSGEFDECKGSFSGATTRRGNQFFKNGTELLYEGRFDTWDAFYHDLVICIGNKLLLNGKDLIYEGPYDTWQTHPEGVVIRIGDKFILKRIKKPEEKKPEIPPPAEARENGQDEVLFEGRCDDWSVSSTQGVLVRNGCEISSNGKKIDNLYNTRNPQWLASPLGFVERIENEIVYHTREGSHKDVYSAKIGSWGLKPSGDIIIQRGNELRDQRGRLLYIGSLDQWHASTIGATIRVGDAFFSNGVRLLYEGPADEWRAGHQDLVVRIGNKFLLNGTELICEGAYGPDWQTHPEGIVVREGDKLILKKIKHTGNSETGGIHEPEEEDEESEGDESPYWRKFGKMWQEKPPKQETITKETSYERAKELMGKDFFGGEAVEKAFGFAPKEIPPIPYSEADLEKAKEMGEMLILRVAEDGEGNAMTLKHMNKITEPKFKTTGGGKFLHDIIPYENEAYFTTDTIKTEWKLVGTNFIQGTIGANHIEQTKKLRDHLKVAGLLTPEEASDCSDTALAEITELVKIDWEAATIKLASLLVNKNHRRSVVEIIYDWMVKYQNTAKNRGTLEQYYDWTNSLASDGRLVGVGRPATFTAWCVHAWRPNDSYHGLGVISVR